MKNNNLNTYHAAAASSSSPVIHQLSNSRDFDESIDIVSTYSVHIPPTPNNQPMVEMQISVRGGGASSFCQVPGCDAVVEESSFPCVCEFRICRDCFNDADGVCPGCHMSYHREAGRIEHPAGGGNEFDSLDSDFLFKKDYGYGGGGIINSISHEHVICELWFSFSWLLDQLPKLCPVKRGVDLELLKEKFETPNPENPAGKSDLPGVDFFVSTADPEKEPPLVTANTILSILAADYPVEKLSCYVSDDGGALLTFEAMAEAASFARLWVPFCRKHYVEPRNPESYFNLRKDPYKGKVRADFVRDRRRVKREYDEFKVRVNGLPNSIRRRSDAYNTHEEIKMMKKVKRGGDGDGDDDEPMMMIERVKIPKATWMADGTHWAGTWITPSPDHTRGDHASIIQEPTKGSRSDGNSMDLSEVDIRLPMLVYVSREKRPGYDHNKKAGAMNALVRASAVMSNGPFILNLDCDHYIYNSEALREGMCFMMDADGDEISYVQFPQRFEGIDPSDRYANHNTVFFDVNMLALDGIQGPVYVGTGCLFRRTAIYGFEPPNSAKERKKSGKKRSSSSYDGGDDDDDDDDAVNIAPLIPKKFGEAVNVISCWYEDKTEWGVNVGWIYGSVTEDVVTGFRMHEKGWRSVYCMTKRDAFRGTAPINLTDRLHQVLRWATGSVEIFFSRNNALLAGTKLKFLQRIAYLNVGIYPFTSVFLLLYCFLPALSLFADQFIVDSLDVDFLAYLLTITITSTLLAVLEIKWSGIALEEWWRNEQFWLIGGTSAHLAAVLQGLLKVIAGIEISFTLTSKSAADEDDEFAELYVIKWTSLMIPPCTIIIVNIVAIAVGLIRTIYSDAPRWNNLLGGAFFSFWVLVHLYPFAKGLMGRRRKTPTIVFVWSALISICISLLWVAVNPPAGQNQIGGSF
ncbi:Cellulose synthase-like protein D2 [Linum perenne]